MRKSKLFLLGAGLVGGLALFACEPIVITAMNLVETTQFTVDGDRLLMNGEINSKTYNQFVEVMAANPQISVLVEQEVPGSLDDDTMIRVAYKLRELGLDTHLEGDSQIYSGGVDLFLAGVRRTMEKGAIIGVHSWSDGFQDAADYPRDAPEHEQNRRYVEDMLGNDSFYWFTIYAAAADDILIMTEAEIIKHRILTGPIE